MVSGSIPGMDENQQDDEITDSVASAGAWLIKTGALDKTERKLEIGLGLTKSEAQDAVAEAYMRLRMSAPEELRPSFTAICSYHRWNHMFEALSSKGDVSGAMEAQRQLDKLMARVH